MNYWIFKSSPKKYKIDLRLQNQERKTTWLVSRYQQEIKAGDVAFIWKTGDFRGICAIIKIESNPKEREELKHELKYYIDLDPGSVCRVLATFNSAFQTISYKKIKKMPGLEELSMFHGYQKGTNFRVTKKEGKILMSMIDELNPTFPLK